MVDPSVDDEQFGARDGLGSPVSGTRFAEGRAKEICATLKAKDEPCLYVPP
jgi:hypothetical protein